VLSVSANPVPQRERDDGCRACGDHKPFGALPTATGGLPICAAEGTPQPIINRLNREIVSVVATADYRNMIENAGSIAASSTPGQLGDVIAQTLAEVAATMQEFGPQQKQ
jgi:hypothetical protein